MIEAYQKYRAAIPAATTISHIPYSSHRPPSTLLTPPTPTRLLICPGPWMFCAPVLLSLPQLGGQPGKPRDGPTGERDEPSEAARCAAAALSTCSRRTRASAALSNLSSMFSSLIAAS